MNACASKRVSFCCVSLVLGGLLGGCSSRYVDPAEVETLILTEFPQTTGLEVASVMCPEKVLVAINENFECQVVLDDQQSLTVVVTQQDDQGALTWDGQTGIKTLSGLIDNERLAQEIKDGIFAQTQIRVTTDCGTRLRLAKPGEVFVCTTTDEQAQRREIQVTVEDNAGKVSWGL